jgi:hypothetical protein
VRKRRTNAHMCIISFIKVLQFVSPTVSRPFFIGKLQMLVKESCTDLCKTKNFNILVIRLFILAGKISKSSLGPTFKRNTTV